MSNYSYIFCTCAIIPKGVFKDPRVDSAVVSTPGSQSQGREFKSNGRRKLCQDQIGNDLLRGFPVKIKNRFIRKNAVTGIATRSGMTRKGVIRQQMTLTLREPALRTS